MALQAFFQTINARVESLSFKWKHFVVKWLCQPHSILREHFFSVKIYISLFASHRGRNFSGLCQRYYGIFSSSASENICFSLLLQLQLIKWSFSCWRRGQGAQQTITRSIWLGWNSEKWGSSDAGAEMIRLICVQFKDNVQDDSLINKRLWIGCRKSYSINYKPKLFLRNDVDILS